MSAALLRRVKALELARKPPAVPLRTVITYTIGQPMPDLPDRPVMLVPSLPDWRAALLAQQRRLTR